MFEFALKKSHEFVFHADCCPFFVFFFLTIEEEHRRVRSSHPTRREPLQTGG